MKSIEIIRKIERDGWYHKKTTGSHWHFKHPHKKGKITVPHPKKEMTKKTLKSIEKQSGVKLL